MPRRGENIYKRKDGRWEGRILTADGKYQYVYARTYREVKEKKETCQEHTTGKEKIGVGQSAAALFQAWLDGDVSGQVKPSTYENYYRCMNTYIIPYFKKYEDRISEVQVGQFINSVCENTTISQSYKRKIISIFKTALRAILKDIDNCEGILKLVKLPKGESSSVQVFSIREQRLVENAAMRARDRRSLGVLLCFYTGIRLGELCALKWGDIDHEAGTLSITKTVSRVKDFKQHSSALLVGMPKSKKSARIIPLPSFLLNLSDDLKIHERIESNYILSNSATPLEPRTYQKLYKNLLAAAGVNNRKFHAIRHTFATRALELSVDIKTLSEILGHSNVSITLNIYAHSMIEQKKIAIGRLNDMHITHMENEPIAVDNTVTNYKIIQ